MHGGNGGWTRSLWLHGALLFGLLVLLLPVVGTSGEVINDEGAVRAQVHLLAGNGTWFMPNGFPEADPTGVAFPIDKAVHTEHGFAPYLKHPLYPLVLAAASTLGGAPGIVLLGVLGTALAAIVSGMITREFAPGRELWTLWAVGVASPLLFDSYMVVAHTLAAAGVALGGFGILRYLRARGKWNLVLVAGGIAWAVALRTEAVLLGIALGIALLLGSLWPAVDRRKSLRSRILAILTLGISAATLVIERWVRGLIAPTVLPSLATTLPTEGYLDDRLHVFVLTWLTPGYANGGARLGGPIIVAAAGCLLAVQCRRRKPDGGLAAVAIVGLWIGAALWVVFDARVVVPGLLVAFPLLPVALVGWRKKYLADQRVRVLATTVVSFAGAVLATSYRVGGTAEWGSRYVAIAIPLVVPLIVLSITSLFARLPEPRRRLSLLALVPLALAPAVVSVLSLREVHRSSVELVDEVSGLVESFASGGDERPVVITDMLSLPRTAWRHLDSARWLAMTDEERNDLLERLHELEVPEFLFLTDDRKPVLGHGYVLDDCGLRRAADTGWRACRATRVPGTDAGARPTS